MNEITHSEKVITKLELLEYIMTEKTPTLLLGAGFSIGAVNEQNEKLPLGKGLAKKMYNHFYVANKPSDYLAGHLDEVKIYEEDLFTLCTLLKNEGRTDDRNRYLIKNFSGCHVDSNTFQSHIVEYPWKFIFTLNIDDFVENIYKKMKLPLETWTRFNNGTYPDDEVPLLIKLHGCVNEPESGFIFDTDEYNEFMAGQTAPLMKLCEEFCSNDIIILGTEFQERDLEFALTVYQRAGFE